MWAEMGVMLVQAGDAWSHRAGEGRKDSPLKPSEGPRPC